MGCAFKCGCTEALNSAFRAELREASPAMLSTDERGARRKLERVINIPIVFNCTGNLAQANDPNLTDAQIEEQVRQLNLDFAAANARYREYCPTGNEDLLPGDAFINFYIQDIRRRYTSALGSNWHTSPDGNPAQTMKRSQYGGLDASHLPTALNIWACYYSDTGAPDGPGSAGYAYYPNYGTPAEQSLRHVVVQSYVVGSDRSPAMNTLQSRGLWEPEFRSGHVLTHEVGHFLGLPHSWEPQGSCETTIAEFDIPAHKQPFAWLPTAYPSPIVNDCGFVSPYNNHMNYSLYLSSFTPLQIAKCYDGLFTTSHEYIGTALRPIKSARVLAARRGGGSATKLYMGGTKLWDQAASPSPPASLPAAATAVTSLSARLIGAGTAASPLRGIVPVGEGAQFRALVSGRLNLQARTGGHGNPEFLFDDVDLTNDSRLPTLPAGYARGQYLYRGGGIDVDEAAEIFTAPGLRVRKNGTYRLEFLDGGPSEYEIVSAIIEQGLATAEDPTPPPPPPPPASARLMPVTAGLLGYGTEDQPMRTDARLTGRFYFDVLSTGVYKFAFDYGAGGSYYTIGYRGGRKVSVRPPATEIPYTGIIPPLPAYIDLTNTRIISAYWLRPS